MTATAGTTARTGTRLATRDAGLVGIESLAREAGMHPELVRRLMRLGLVEPHGGTRAAPLFRRQDALLLARAMRLHRDLGVNYAGAVLACELLARIDQLEQRLAGRGLARQSMR
jgi:DNA-binding transcriptional MerR regulator